MGLDEFHQIKNIKYSVTIILIYFLPRCGGAMMEEQQKKLVMKCGQMIQTLDMIELYLFQGIYGELRLIYRVAISYKVYQKTYENLFPREKR